jgi:hypothetical protein
MDSQKYAEKLRDPRWQRRRLEIFQRDNWACQLCGHTKLELHVHHLYRTTEDPWDEPDLNLLTVCQLCHEQQPSNPHGWFKNPKRLYVTDDEWWRAVQGTYDAETREKFDEYNLSGLTIREVNRKCQARKEGIHALRLAWEEKRKKEAALKGEAKSSTVP